MCMCMWSPATGKQACTSNPSHSPRLGPDLVTSNHKPLTLALALALGSARTSIRLMALSFSAVGQTSASSAQVVVCLPAWGEG